MVSVYSKCANWKKEIFLYFLISFFTDSLPLRKQTTKFHNYQYLLFKIQFIFKTTCHWNFNFCRPFSNAKLNLSELFLLAMCKTRNQPGHLKANKTVSYISSDWRQAGCFFHFQIRALKDKYWMITAINNGLLVQ